MKKFVFAALAGATVLTAMPALAQESGDWSGFYAGGRIGYGFQPNDNDETILFDKNLDGNFDDTVTTVAGADAFSPGFCGGQTGSPRAADGCGGDFDGVEWAAHVGYDMQLGSSVVVGVVGDYGMSTVRDHVTAFSTTPAYYTMTRRLKDNASLRLRAGFAAGDTLFYGTGGVAWGKIKNSFRTSNGANAFSGNGNKDAWGYRFGGGIEQKVAPNFSIGAQYLYTSLKDDDYRVRAARGTAPATNPFILTNADGTDFRRSGTRFNSHGVSVTANYRF